MFSTLWNHKKLFILVVLSYSLFTALLVGIWSQDTYSQLRELLQQTGEGAYSGSWGEIGNAGLLLVSGIGGSIAPALTESQQIYSSLLLIMTWLTTVWLLRALMAGNSPKLRDGIYSSGAPIISTILVAMLLVVQLLPIALVVITYTVTTATDFLSNPFISMIFWLIASAFSILSVYWFTSTLIALIVVTLPGMYPIQAIRTAGDLVVGRRIRILLRIIWLIASLFIAWAVVMIPVIIFDSWLKSVIQNIDFIPVVPVIALITASFSTVWASSYMYMLYRRIVEDDASPA